jgi:hypothetical protein
LHNNVLVKNSKIVRTRQGNLPLLKNKREHPDVVLNLQYYIKQNRADLKQSTM